jgi:hypothetical protein
MAAVVKSRTSSVCFLSTVNSLTVGRHHTLHGSHGDGA